MINLNDFNQEEKDVKIFNDGNAGRVKNVAVSVTKKTAQDKENAPDYKINYTQEDGASVNDAVYYPKDDDSDSRKRIAISRLLNVLHSLNPETKSKMLPEFENYTSAVDFLMKQIIASSKTGRVNIFVAYGTKNNPSQYLRVRKFNFVEPANTEDNETKLRPKISPDPEKEEWNDVMERIVPTSFEEEVSDDENSDAGLDDW